MADEQLIIDWFMAHPFVRNVLLLAMGSVSGLALKDWQRFKEYKVGDPTATFNWRVAIGQYLHGITIGVVPPVVAKLWLILGGV